MRKPVTLCGSGLLAVVLVGTPAAEAQTCSTNADCDDAEPCTVDICNFGTGFCEIEPEPGAMFATDGGGGKLYRVDQTTGAASLIGSTGTAAQSLAVDPATSVAYAGSGGGADDLYTVDTVTASLHLVGNGGLGGWSIEGLDFDAGGTLHASVNTIGSGSLGGDSLATFDKTTGAGTLVGSFGVTDIAGVAFDVSGSLYGSSGGGSPTLYTIDVATGAATPVGPIVDGGGSPPSAGVRGLQFDLDGTLYGGTSAGELLRIDPASAVFTSVGSSGAAELGALAVRDECPRPCRPPLRLYATAWPDLYRVDPVTGSTTWIGTEDLVPKPSLAIDPLTGVYYSGLGGGFEDLQAVCPITALSAFIGDAGLDAFALSGLDFDDAGTLYASVNTIGSAQGGGDTLAILDKQTAIGTTVGPFGVEGLGSIAFGAAGTLYGAPGHPAGTPSLYTIDPATGAATLVGPLVDPLGMPPPNPVAGIEFDLAGFLYGATARGQVPTEAEASFDLIRIDPTTGLFTVVGELGTVKGLGGLSFHQTCRPKCRPPSRLFGSDDGGNLHEIDQVSGEAAPIGGMGVPAASLAVDPTTGLLYAGTGSGLDELYRVDPATGVATPVGSTGLGCWSVVGLDFDADGTLYAAVNTIGPGDPGGDSLAVLDETTGAGTIVGSFGAGIADIGGLVVSDSGTLYGSSGVGGAAPSLYVIDPATGAASPVGPILDVLGAPPEGGVTGLELDLGGVLYGSLDGGGLIRIDPANGNFSPVAASGVAALEGLAFLDDCPIDCARDTHCDDGNPCTAESCQPASRKCVTNRLPDSETASGFDGVCGTADDNSALFGVDGLCGTADDGAGDGLCDSIDLCPAVWDPGNVDRDGDGAGDACDCAPLDDGVWEVPGEVPGLQVEHHGGPGGTTTLTWGPPPSPGATSLAYDTLRSDTSDTFAAPEGQCVESDDGSDRTATDTFDPSPIFFYVVRAENGCGPGTIGAYSNGTPRPSRACP